MSQTVPPLLLLIDPQRAIYDLKWGSQRNNPRAEKVVADLLAQWQSKNWPVWHVRHDQTDPASPYRPNQPGNEFIASLGPQRGELAIAKQTNSAFVGTNLKEQRDKEQRDAQGCRTIMIAGVITNNPVEATVHTAGNLGYDVLLVEDGCFTLGKRDWNGASRSAEDIHAMPLANLNDEYCTVVTALQLMNTSEKVR